MLLFSFKLKTYAFYVAKDDREKDREKDDEMHAANYSDKRSFKLCFLHNCTALISVIAVFVLSNRSRRSRPKIVSSLLLTMTGT